MKLLAKGSLSLFALFMFMGMFAACSSSEEDSSSSGGGEQSCAEKCAEQEPLNTEECVIACEA